MKKNTMMRIASALLVLTLLSTCAISGTFAKYVTTTDSNDSARVAKWGVTVETNGGAFAKEYTGTDSAVTVKTDSTISDKNLVAPGTSGTFDGFNVTGKPEVKVNVTLTADLDLGETAAWEVENAFYCPITITVNGTSYCGLDYDSASAFETAVETAITAANGQYDVNTDLSQVTGLNGDYAWEWAFVGEATYTAVENAVSWTADTYYSKQGDTYTLTTEEPSDWGQNPSNYYTMDAAKQTDAKDTALGNKDNNALDEISLSVSVTVTQVD